MGGVWGGRSGGVGKRGFIGARGLLVAHRGSKERLGAGLRQGAGLVEGDGIAQHNRHVIDLGGGGGILRQGLHAAGHHNIAEGAAGGDFFRAGL